jgi:hypothetical protein
VFCALRLLANVAGRCACFVWQGIVRYRLRFEWAGGFRASLGTVLLAFALVVYPAWSWYSGHNNPAIRTFGLRCPTTIYNICSLAFAVATSPRSPLVIPVLCCLVGAQAAFMLSVRQDLELVVAPLAGLVLLIRPGLCASPDNVVP